MKIVGISLVLYGLVGAAKTKEIGADHAVAGIGKDGNHLAIEISPGGFAVQTQKSDSGLA